MKYTLALLAAALAVPSAASAVTLDFAADYGNAAFSYGSGTAPSFTAFANVYGGGCFGVAQFACQTVGSNSIQPVIGVATDGLAFTVQTVDVPANTLVFHPGPEDAGSDAILVFTAPVTTTYTFAGQFLRLDRQNGDGDGVTLSAYINGLPAPSAFSSLPNSPQYASIPLAGAAFLNAGDTVLFAVGKGGNYFNDATGLQGTITFNVVPEPATWAMMIGGFGLVGGAVRRRRMTVRFA